MTEDQEPEPRPRSVGMDGRPAGIRTFSLNSDEAYAALCPPPDPWRWGPGLPSESRSWDREVIVESGRIGGSR